MKSKSCRSVWARQNLDDAWRKIASNARTSGSDDVRREVQSFSENSSGRLASIQNRLSRSKFDFKPARGIPIPKRDAKGIPTGKVRPIVLAPLETRIVQRALLNVLTKNNALSAFVNTPHSFGGIKRSGSPADSDAVPGAIAAILTAIQRGAAFYAKADISNFFTRVPKDSVRTVIKQCINDDEFLNLYDKCVRIELENMAQLAQYADQFPTHEIGVAQGNSLSPLIGNIALFEFDEVINRNDCTGIRYIDDFIILGPTQEAVDRKFRQAKAHLKAMGMPLEATKSSHSAAAISKGIEFLGIEILPGLIRPSKGAQQKMLAAVRNDIDSSVKAMSCLPVERDKSLTATLRRIDGRLTGWRKHYWFCNDRNVFENLNSKIDDAIRQYLGRYVALRDKGSEDAKRSLLGITDLRVAERTPFSYPSKTNSLKLTSCRRGVNP